MTTLGRGRRQEIAGSPSAPKVAAPVRSPQERGAFIVSISGRAGAGKSTVARMLKELVSCIVIPAAPEMLARLGSPRTETNDTDVETAWRAGQPLVVDGVDSPLQRTLLAKRFGTDYLSIHVDAPREVRMLRVLGWSEFDHEFYAADDRIGPAIDKVGLMANYHISNGGSLEQLVRQVAPLAGQLRAPDG